MSWKVVFGHISANNETYSYKEFCLDYEKRGVSTLLSLKGEFSFALFDPNTKSYFCARDPLGVKPLYYTKVNEKYHFSSTIEDLLKLPSVHNIPNLDAMKSMLSQRRVNYEETMYKNIYRLPPGHFMIVEEAQEHIERYWFPEKIKIDYSISEEEAVQKFKKLFAEAIESRITNLKETAFEVSGGLDSSSVVSFLSQKDYTSILDSYSMDFQALPCDESRYVNRILDKYPLNHQKIQVDKLDYSEEYSLKNLYVMSPNWPITLTFAMSLPMLYKMKQDGKKVVITGQGGDHIFTGSLFVLYDLFRRFKWISLYHELKHHTKPWLKIKSYIIKPLLGERLTKYILVTMGKTKSNLLLNDVEYIEDLSYKIGITNPIIRNELDMVTSAGYSTMMDSCLFHCAEGYYDIEFRHPFFDKELVEFALSLPPEMKYKNKTIKWILRKAMDGILPDKIRERKDKAEFSEVIIQQIDAIDLDTLLKDPYIVKLGLIEQSLIDKYRKEYEEKTSRYIVFLWTIINMEYWYRYNFEKETLEGI